MKTFHLTLFAGFLLATSTSHARPVRNWTYEDLLKESDLVVIADVVDAKVVPTTDDLSGLPSFWHGFQQIETVSLVRAVMKGKHEQKRLVLVHFDFGPRGNVFVNGPMLFRFPKSDQIARTVEKGNERVYGKDYLLFLKARKDGKYDPVTGQVDPVFSVRELGEPEELFFRRTSE